MNLADEYLRHATTGQGSAFNKSSVAPESMAAFTPEIHDLANKFGLSLATERIARSSEKEKNITGTIAFICYPEQTAPALSLAANEIGKLFLIRPVFQNRGQVNLRIERTTSGHQLHVFSSIKYITISNTFYSVDMGAQKISHFSEYWGGAVPTQYGWQMKYNVENPVDRTSLIPEIIQAKWPSALLPQILDGEEIARDIMKIIQDSNHLIIQMIADAEIERQSLSSVFESFDKALHALNPN